MYFTFFFFSLLLRKVLSRIPSLEIATLYGGFLTYYTHIEPYLLCRYLFSILSSSSLNMICLRWPVYYIVADHFCIVPLLGLLASGTVGG